MSDKDFQDYAMDYYKYQCGTTFSAEELKQLMKGLENYPNEITVKKSEWFKLFKQEPMTEETMNKVWKRETVSILEFAILTRMNFLVKQLLFNETQKLSDTKKTDYKDYIEVLRKLKPQPPLLQLNTKMNGIALKLVLQI